MTILAIVKVHKWFLGSKLSTRTLLHTSFVMFASPGVLSLCFENLEARYQDEGVPHAESLLLKRRNGDNYKIIPPLSLTSNKACTVIEGKLRWKMSPVLPTAHEIMPLCLSTGASSGSSGARPLSDREWESLLLYSYILRRVAHAASDSAVQVGTTGGNSGVACRQTPAVRQGSEERKERTCRCGNTSSAGVGLRGLRCLRGTSTHVSRKSDDKRARRPSSAPAKRDADNELPWRRRSRTEDDAISAECTRAQHTMAPGKWGVPEVVNLLDCLVRKCLIFTTCTT